MPLPICRDAHADNKYRPATPYAAMLITPIFVTPPRVFANIISLRFSSCFAMLLIRAIRRHGRHYAIAAYSFAIYDTIQETYQKTAIPRSLCHADAPLFSPLLLR